MVKMFKSSGAYYNQKCRPNHEIDVFLDFKPTFKLNPTLNPSNKVVILIVVLIFTFLPKAEIDSRLGFLIQKKNTPT